MYLDFYNLKAPPFNITSDPDFFFESSSHREALATLLYGIQERKGLILITGEVGTGKTTLCKTLLGKLDCRVKASVIFNSYTSEVQLLQAIVEDFGLKLREKNRLDIVKKLNSFLLNISSKRSNAVLIIDEAQNLTPHQLEQVRLLSNLETYKAKLLQIILIGQPELAQKLQDFRLRQIRQRVFLKYNISPLGETEIKDYIEFRLARAGSDSGIEILPQCYKIIYDFTKGIPRLINMLCDRVLLLGFVKEKKVFDEEIFRECIEEIK